MSSFNNASPDITAREIDLTNTVGAGGSSSAGFAGNFNWGPAGVITRQSTETQLASEFGKPDDVNFADFLSVASFLAYTQDVQVVRVIDEDAINSSDDAAGILIKNDAHFQEVSAAPTSVQFAARYPGALGDSISVHVADSETFAGWEYANQFDFAPGTSSWAASIGAKNDELHVIVIDKLGEFSGVVGGVLERYPFVSKASDSRDGNNAPNFYQSKINKNSRYVYALAKPTGAAVVDPSTGAVDTVTVGAGGSGYTAAPTVTFSAPTVPGGRVAKGTAVLTADAVTSITITDAGAGYTDAPTVTLTGGAGTGATATAALGTVSASAEWGVKGVVLGVPSVFKSLASRLELPLTGGKNSTAITAQELIEGYRLFGNQEEADVGSIFSGPAGGADQQNIVNQYIADMIAEVRQDLVFYHSPKLDDVLNKTLSVAADNCVRTRNEFGRSSSYCFMDSGWKLMYDVYSDKMRWVPLNGDMAGLGARVDNQNDPWDSPGGYTRGRLLNVVSLAWNPDKTARDTIYKVGINPVVTFKVDGTILYGDKTMQGKDSAFSQIGVRKLFNNLKGSIKQSSRQFLFEHNTQFTRASFVNMVTPRLEEVRGRGGIDDFRVVCDESNNGPEVRMQKRFVGSIFVKPNYSINWVELNFVAVRQDVAFEEVVNVQF